MGAAETQDEIKRNAQPLLQPGEEIQAAILAQTFNSLVTLLLGPVIVFGKPFRPIVVTNRRILVFRSGGFRMTKLSAASDELPRNTPLGPASGRRWYRTTALGRPIYIFPSFYGEVAAADAAIQAPP
jgi:hypothetical protein